MSFNLTSPVTGAAQTGFTSPTYTLVPDTAPTINGRQVAVSAVGGTQVGVNPNTVAAPFTVTFVRPATLRVLGQPNPITGLISNVPSNTYKVITRKGVVPLTGQPNKTMLVTTTIEVPAGSDTADPANVKAALSAHIGSLQQQAAGIGDTTVSGVM